MMTITMTMMMTLDIAFPAQDGNNDDLCFGSDNDDNDDDNDDD